MTSLFSTSTRRSRRGSNGDIEKVVAAAAYARKRGTHVLDIQNDTRTPANRFAPRAGAAAGAASRFTLPTTRPKGRCRFKTEQWLQHPLNASTLVGLCAIVLYVALGTIISKVYEPSWSVLEAVYFTVVSITTVGYGDFSPTFWSHRVINSLYLLFGVGFVGVFLNLVVQGNIHRVVVYLATKCCCGTGQIPGGAATGSAHDDFTDSDDDDDDDDDIVEVSGDAAFANTTTKCSAFCDAKVSLPTRKALILVGGLVFLIFFGTCFFYFFGSKDFDGGEPRRERFAKCFAHVVVTLTTVGYGDTEFENELTMLFATPFIIFGVLFTSATYVSIVHAFSNNLSARSFQKLTEDPVAAAALLRSQTVLTLRQEGVCDRDEFLAMLCLQMGWVDASDLRRIYTVFDRLNTHARTELVISGALNASDQEGVLRESGGLSGGLPGSGDSGRRSVLGGGGVDALVGADGKARSKVPRRSSSLGVDIRSQRRRSTRLLGIDSLHSLSPHSMPFGALVEVDDPDLLDGTGSASAAPTSEPDRGDAV